MARHGAGPRHALHRPPDTPGWPNSTSLVERLEPARAVLPRSFWSDQKLRATPTRHLKSAPNEITGAVPVQLEVRVGGRGEVQAATAICRAQPQGIARGTSVGPKRFPGTLLQVLGAIHQSMASLATGETSVPPGGANRGGRVEGPARHRGLVARLHRSRQFMRCRLQIRNMDLRPARGSWICRIASFSCAAPRHRRPLISSLGTAETKVRRRRLRSRVIARRHHRSCESIWSRLSRTIPMKSYTEAMGFSVRGRELPSRPSSG